MADQLTPFLRQILRITTTDNRIFLGTLAGTDQPLNLVLVNAEEFRMVPVYPNSAPDRMQTIHEEGESQTDRAGRVAHETEMRLENVDGRFVGQILVPWKMIAKVEASIAGQYGSDEDYS
ncbi:hypothetical protein BDZ89DRAFT_483878 [Hymenopellis radicata]|nr:hypothetical protein BDZ89DRAFT_483878 [Hymenopellis radicata]